MRLIIPAIITAVLLCAPAGAQSANECLDWLPHSDYGPVDRAPAIASLMEAHRWSDAIAAVEDLLLTANPADLRIEPHRWRVVIGWFYIFQLDPKPAVAQFKSVLKNTPSDSRDYEIRLERWEASQGMAYALMLEKQYGAAARWNDRSAVQPGLWCGNGIETEGFLSDAISQTWRAAAISHPTDRLKKLRAMGYVPKRSRLMRNLHAEKDQKRLAAEHATLLLAIEADDRGETTEALRLLRALTQGATTTFDVRMIALARLDHVQAALVAGRP